MSPVKADEFSANGFVIVEDVFSPDEIAGISSEVDRIISGEVSYVPERDIVYEPGSEPRRVRNAFRLHIYHPRFWK